MYRIKAIAAILSAAGLWMPASAWSQNTSTVSGADVKAGDRSFEYRAAFAPAHDGKPGAFAHRLHYQHSLNDSIRLKIIGLQTKRSEDEWRFKSVTLEAQWQFKESEHDGWDSALRIDGRIPTESGHPGRARAAWLNSVDIDDRWQMRGNVFIGREFGDLRDDGFSLVTQAEATYKLPSKIRVGAQLFSDFNTTADFGSFSEQRHQAGLIVKGKITDALSYNAGVLFGLSAAASDTDIRLFLNYAL